VVVPPAPTTDNGTDTLAGGGVSHGANRHTFAWPRIGIGPEPPENVPVPFAAVTCTPRIGNAAGSVTGTTISVVANVPPGSEKSDGLVTSATPEPGMAIGGSDAICTAMLPLNASGAA